MTSKTFEVTIEGYKISGYYSYEAGFKGDDINPPYGPTVIIEEIYVNNSPHDAGDLIASGWFDYLEDYIISTYES